jgi:pilus assembly protein TadC
MILLAGLLVAAAVWQARGLPDALRRAAPLESLVDLHRRSGLPRRLPWLDQPLRRLCLRLDARTAPSPERLLVELEVGLAAGLGLGSVTIGAASGLAAAAGGCAARVASLVGRAARREAAVLRDLPVMLDLLAMAVEGGLPIGAALALAARRGPAGPLRDGLALVVAAVSAGTPRADALDALRRALPHPGVAAFATALAQSDRLGGRLAPGLRAQAAQRRAERWHRAERRALLAPVRLLVPLAVCIFPATFVVLLLPLALRLAGELGP